MTTTETVSDMAVVTATGRYLDFLYELERLERVGVADRDLAAIHGMTTDSWGEHVERLLFQVPEYIDQSTRESEATVDGTLLSGDEVELKACLVRFPKLVYADGGDLAGDGSRQRFGFRVTMRLVHGAWLVDEERFQQSLCNELGVDP